MNLHGVDPLGRDAPRVADLRAPVERHHRPLPRRHGVSAVAVRHLHGRPPRARRPTVIDVVLLGEQRVVAVAELSDEPWRYHEEEDADAGEESEARGARPQPHRGVTAPTGQRGRTLASPTWRTVRPTSRSVTER